MNHSKLNWLELNYAKNLESDIFMILMKHNYLLWRLFNKFKCRKLALFIGRIQYFQAEYIKKMDTDKTYDEILEDCYKIIIEVIKKYKICPLLKKVKYKNVRGFDIFNASAASYKNKKNIAINTGLFFLSHTLVNSILQFCKTYGFVYSGCKNVSYLKC